MLGADLPGLAACRQCPRLSRHMAALPPRRGLDRSDYWNAPVPGFGDPRARVCLVGLAPGAHGANRTGRPFTGDGAGDFMYPLLHEAGFASQAEAVAADDGLTLRDLYITNAVKCLPPDNKPETAEFERCRLFLERELESLVRLGVVVLLGQGAFTSYLRLLRARGDIERIGAYPFMHGALYRPPRGPSLVASYHTSRYNIQTGRMNREMFLALLEKVRALAAENG